MESYISKNQFKLIASNLVKYIIAKEFHLRIDYENLTLRIFRDKNLLEYEEILAKYSINESPAAIAFIKQVILSDYALKTFKSRRRINTQFAWRLIFDSLSFFKKEDPFAGVGSQGFLSIELYRFESNDDRRILRLHIWDDSFGNSFEENVFRKYKVSSPQYFGQVLVY